MFGSNYKSLFMPLESSFLMGELSYYTKYLTRNVTSAILCHQKG
jgi:hypothetical protein